MSVAERYRDVLARVRVAEAHAGRKTGEVKLIAVSKTKPLTMINQAAVAGALEFAENYVREGNEKAALRPDLVWHFIGSLQTNKAKEVVGTYALIHSVDREKLARELDKAAEARGLFQEILVQVRIGDEASKHGVAPEEAASFVMSLQQFPRLRVRGLMTLPPLSDSETQARGYFAQLREIAERARGELSKLRPEAAQIFNVLSMGTTHDFEWAILEGATHVRVGTAIFGERNT